MSYYISTRRSDTLQRWLDEILPVANYSADTESTIGPASITIQPMSNVEGQDPDWFTDSRFYGRIYHICARNGADGMKEIADIKRDIENEMRKLGS